MLTITSTFLHPIHFYQQPTTHDDVSFIILFSFSLPSLPPKISPSLSVPIKEVFVQNVTSNLLSIRTKHSGCDAHFRSRASQFSTLPRPILFHLPSIFFHSPFPLFLLRWKLYFSSFKLLLKYFSCPASSSSSSSCS